jgi:fructuronate reductase
MQTSRLSSTTLRMLRAPGPTWRAGPGDVRIAHLGPGPFHRAHQAAITDLVAATQQHGDGWGIGAYASRGTSTVSSLAEQDMLSSVLVRDAREDTIRVLGVLGAVGTRSDFAAALSHERTSIATITVSEAHYPANDRRRLEFSEPSVAADLAAAAGSSVRSLPGLLHAGLVGRWRSHGAPVSVLSCDNLRANGRLLRTLVTEYAEAAGAASAYLSWLETSVAFPCTLVDRLTPTPDAADRADAAGLLGVEDQCCVVTEAAWEWAIEDVLVADAPAWHSVGAKLVRDVEPYEQRKLVLLNATHSLLAPWGLLLGYDTVAEALRDPDISEFVTKFHTQEVEAPSPDGAVDFADYAVRVRARLSNPGLRHRLTQIAADSSIKLGERVLPLVRAAGTSAELPLAAAGTAAWLRLHDPFASAPTGSVRDPHAVALRSALGDEDPFAAVAAALRACGLFRDGDPAPFGGRVAEAFSGLRSADPRRVLRDFL